jgi:hypothetical protein
VDAKTNYYPKICLVDAMKTVCLMMKVCLIHLMDAMKTVCLMMKVCLIHLMDAMKMV